MTDMARRLAIRDAMQSHRVKTKWGGDKGGSLFVLNEWTDETGKLCSEWVDASDWTIEHAYEFLGY